MCLICIVIFASLLTYTESAKYKETCGEPGKPTGGNYTDTGPYTIKYNCKNEGDYRLTRIIGIETRICQPDGTWNHPIPWCEPNLFYTMNGTNFMGEDAKRWERLYNKTDGGPELNENVTIKLLKPTAIKELAFTVKDQLRCATNPGWTILVKNETGAVNCTLKDYITHDLVLKGAIYNCSNTIANEIFIDSDIAAEVVDFGIYGNSSVETCGEPDIPANGSMSGRTNRTVHYTCNIGFSLVGNSTVTCRGRQWSGNAPTCITTSTGFLEVHGSTLVMLITLFVVVVILSVIAVGYYKIDRRHFERVNNFES